MFKIKLKKNIPLVSNITLKKGTICMLLKRVDSGCVYCQSGNNTFLLANKEYSRIKGGVK